MVCYRIFLLCPLFAIENRNTLNDKCLKLLVKQNNGYLIEIRESHGSNIIVLDICDKDASHFMWHLPFPFTVLFVVVRNTNALLFSHRIFKFKVPCISRDSIVKGVYWSAKSLENHLGNVKIEIEDYLHAIQSYEK